MQSLTPSDRTGTAGWEACATPGRTPEPLAHARGYTTGDPLAGARGYIQAAVACRVEKDNSCAKTGCRRKLEPAILSRPSMPPRTRVLLTIGLVIGLLLCSGCVYLHLLQLKLQLADFDKNFEVDARDGLTLTFKNPVLLDEDVQSFFKWTPDTRKSVGMAERWHFRWVKDRVAADGGRPPVELAIDALFSEHKLVRLSAPEAFFAASMPKQLALAAIRSLGHANVDKEKRRADSQLSASDLEAAAADRFLTENGILAALGAPVEKRGTATAPEWWYHFTPGSSHQHFGDGGAVDMTFTLDASTHRVLLMKGKTAFGSVVFDTTKTAQGGNVQAGI